CETALRRSSPDVHLFAGGHRLHLRVHHQASACAASAEALGHFVRPYATDRSRNKSAHSLRHPETRPANLQSSSYHLPQALQPLHPRSPCRPRVSPLRWPRHAHGGSSPALFESASARRIHLCVLASCTRPASI